jgi:AraC-like DNA-binding protein
MYITNSLLGSEATQYELKSVTVAETKLYGVDGALITQPTICFYSHEPAYSREVWAGKAELRKHWNVGSVGFMPAGAEITSTPEQPYRETAIKFSAGLFGKAIDGLIDPSQIDFRFADVTSHVTTGLASVIQNLAVTGAYVDAEMLVENVALSLAVAIVRQFTGAASKVFTAPDVELCDGRLTRVRDFIEANLSRRISLIELADVAALSQYHFSRQFQRKLGISPMRYVMQRRVEMAKVQLLRPEETIASVAYSCGFGGQSHFSTTFKTFTGITPGEYRRTRGLPHLGMNP